MASGQVLKGKVQFLIREETVLSAISLRTTCYAVHSTVVLYGGKVRYQPMFALCLARYCHGVLRSTELAYGAMRYFVLGSRMVLRNTQY
eukprot:513329-Rhodomonas_salina.4